MEELSTLVAPGTGIREFYVQTLPQVAVRVIEFNPASPGNLPVVVFVAGWVTQISAWKEVLQELTRDFRVFYLETREKISSRILKEIHRGVTILHGQGGYSEQEQRILYTVVSFQEIAILKRIVRSEDPDAFVVVSDTAEVMGHRIGNQPHW